MTKSLAPLLLTPRPLIGAAALLGVLVSPVLAADGGDAVHGPPGQGSPRYVTPDSSLEKPGDVGRRAHTNYGVVVPPPITGPGNTVPPAPR